MSTDPVKHVVDRFQSFIVCGSADYVDEAAAMVAACRDDARFTKAEVLGILQAISKAIREGGRPR